MAGHDEVRVGFDCNHASQGPVSEDAIVVDGWSRRAR